MSRTSEVLKSRSKLEKARKLRRKQEMNSLRDRSAYKAKLYDELRHIDVLLEDNDIDAIVIEVKDNLLAQFNSSIYSEDLVGYDIQQKEDNPNIFYIRRKFVAF